MKATILDAFYRHRDTTPNFKSDASWEQLANEIECELSRTYITKFANCMSRVKTITSKYVRD